MRRICGLLLACTLAAAHAVALTASPAAAHACAVAAEIPVGRPAPVRVAVTVETTPVAHVEIEFPQQLQLESVDPEPGWTFTTTGQIVRADGPSINAYSCQYFNVRLTATKKGTYGITVRQLDDAGGVVTESAPVPGKQFDPLLVQTVYAGVKPGGSSSAGPSPALIAGLALIVVAIAILVIVRVRSSRGGHAERRAAELEDRAEEFRKQARARRS